MKQIVIIGNGISGITTARYIRKHSDAQITIISDESKYFFSRTALMYVFMGQVRFQDTYPYEKDFYKKNRLELIFDRVEAINFQQKKVLLKKGKSQIYDDLVLALGSKPRRLNVLGEDLSGIQSLYRKQDLENLEARRGKIKKAVVIGGGLIGVELAEMLKYQGAEVDFLIRETSFWSESLSKTESDFVEAHIKEKGIRLHFEEEVDQFFGEKAIESLKTKKGKMFQTDFAGICIGVEPNVDFLKNKELVINSGILINSYFETSHANVYAIGDCAEHRVPLLGRKSLEQIWYTGKAMGMQLGTNLGSGTKKAYEPGNWFNSAKFFDIEFQSYGVVKSKVSAEQEEFIWRYQNKMLRFVFEKSTSQFLGVNAFNIKLRQIVFDYWLSRKVTIDEVLSQFDTVSFEGEFRKSIAKKIVEDFNQQFGRSVELKKKKWYQKLVKK